jgi:hypothetical protein
MSVRGTRLDRPRHVVRCPGTMCWQTVCSRRGGRGATSASILSCLLFVLFVIWNAYLIRGTFEVRCTCSVSNSVVPVSRETDRQAHTSYVANAQHPQSSILNGNPEIPACVKTCHNHDQPLNLVPRSSCR